MLLLLMMMMMMMMMMLVLLLPQGQVLVHGADEDTVFEAAIDAGADDVQPVFDEEGNPTNDFKVGGGMVSMVLLMMWGQDIHLSSGSVADVTTGCHGGRALRFMMSSTLTGRCSSRTDAAHVPANPVLHSHVADPAAACSAVMCACMWLAPCSCSRRWRRSAQPSASCRSWGWW